MTDPAQLRAGDQDRDRTAAFLGEALAAGRLTQQEYEQRLDRTHRAVTYADLQAVTADLPGAGSLTPGGPLPPVAPVPAVADPGTSPTGGSRRRKGLAAGWASWASVSLLMVAIWLFQVVSHPNHETASFWPFWVIVPWGVAMVGASIAGRDR